METHSAFLSRGTIRRLMTSVANLKTNFGDRLKSLRKAHGLTQEELGRAVGVDYKHIGAIERGIRAPSFDVIERIAKALKVQPHQLFLPASDKGTDVEEDIRVVVKGLKETQRAAVQQFFTEVLRTMKRLGLD